MRTAAEAMIELLGRTDRKGRTLLAMEGAACQQVGTALAELDVALYDLDDIDAVEQILLE